MNNIYKCYWCKKPLPGGWFCTAEHQQEWAGQNYGAAEKEKKKSLSLDEMRARLKQMGKESPYKNEPTPEEIFLGRVQLPYAED